MNKTCIVNVGIGGWYPKGTERLRDSLDVNYEGDMLFYSDARPPKAKPHTERNYGFKVHAIAEAKKRGYQNIIWLDCSMYAVKNIQPIIDIIEKQGYFWINNGYNAAQTLTDKALRNLGITRDEAEKITEVASGCFGLNFTDPRCHDFFNEWKVQEMAGSFNGSRSHNLLDSEDPRFLFCRHDQSIASVLLHRFGMTELSHWGAEADYWANNKENNHSVIICRGM